MRGQTAIQAAVAERPVQHHAPDPLRQYQRPAVRTGPQDGQLQPAVHDCRIDGPGVIGPAEFAQTPQARGAPGGSEDVEGLDGGETATVEQRTGVGVVDAHRPGRPRDLRDQATRGSGVGGVDVDDGAVALAALKVLDADDVRRARRLEIDGQGLYFGLGEHHTGEHLEVAHHGDDVRHQRAYGSQHRVEHDDHRHHDPAADLMVRQHRKGLGGDVPFQVCRAQAVLGRCGDDDRRGAGTGQCVLSEEPRTLVQPDDTHTGLCEPALERRIDHAAIPRAPTERADHAVGPAAGGLARRDGFQYRVSGGVRGLSGVAGPRRNGGEQRDEPQVVG